MTDRLEIKEGAVQAKDNDGVIRLVVLDRPSPEVLARWTDDYEDDIDIEAVIQYGVDNGLWGVEG